MTSVDDKFLKDLESYINNTENITIDEVGPIKQELLYLVIDKSASMYNNGLENGVIKGLEALKRVVNESDEVNCIQTAMTFFGSTLDMRPFQSGGYIDISYRADGIKTRLYDAIVESCKNMIKQYDKLKKDYKLKAIMLIFTDGEENGSKKYKLEDVQASFNELNKRRIKYCIAAYNGADLMKLCKDLCVEPDELYKIKNDYQLRTLLMFPSKYIKCMYG